MPVVLFASANPFTDKPQLHTADGLNGLLASIRGHFGDTTGYELVVYPEYAVLDRASPTNEHAEQSFIYRGDWESWAPDTSVSSFDHLADLSRFDAAGVSAALSSAAEKLGIHDATGTYLVIQGSSAGFSKRSDAAGLDMAVYVSAPASGRIEITPGGDVIKLHPPGE